MQVLEQIIASADVKSLIGKLVNPLICDALSNFTSNVVSPMLRNVSNLLSQLEAMSISGTLPAEERAWQDAEAAVKARPWPLKSSRLAFLPNSTFVSLLSRVANLILSSKAPCYLGAAEAGRLGINGLLAPCLMANREESLEAPGGSS